jgi:hypothetical protein
VAGMVLRENPSGPALRPVGFRTRFQRQPVLARRLWIFRAGTDEITFEYQLEV